MYLQEPGPADQGAIVESPIFHQQYSTSAAIILTPRCDIGRDRSDFLTVAACVPPESVYEKIAKGTTPKAHSNALVQMMQGRAYRWHWLAPHTRLFPLGAIVDFQCVQFVSEQPFLTEASVLCCLASTWREHLATRYAFYAGRVGVEDVDPKQLMSYANRIIQHVGAS